MMGEVINKPWGHELIWAKTDLYIGKILFIRSGNRLSRQYHKQKEETVYVLSGVLIVWEEEDNEYFLLGKGSSYHVEPLQIHRFGAGEEDVRLIEVSTPYLDDVVRLQDDYQRTTKGPQE
jgi:mannose-6-phosphate isomerase